MTNNSNEAKNFSSNPIPPVETTMSNASPCPVSPVGTDGLFGPHSTTGMFITKDSGKREEYDSGMRRDVEEGKTDFTYLIIDGVPFQDQPLHRLMGLYMRGAEKYGRHNWQKACSREEYERFKRSLFRHWMQYLAGDRDEDHIAAVVWNAIAIMYMEQKLELLKEDLSE